MSTNFNKVLELMESLNPDEKRIIYKRLRDDIRFNMNAILESVNERVGDQPFSLEEITKEVEDVRGMNHGTH